ncbi:MAG: tetratricopeptide repeat protein [Planctomycetes bacterium]|nr:tetratricopeptide repeat protein [Planctomycetota bacterium]
MNSRNTVRLRTFCVIAAVALGSAGADSAYAQGPLAAPKGSIADIAAVLEQQKPPPERLAREAKQRDAAAAQPPENADASTLADFYYRRGQVKMWINRWAEALKNGERALQYAKEAPPNPQLSVDLYGLLATTSFNNGLNGQSARYRQEQIKAANDAGIRGVQVSASKSMAQFHMLRNNWEEAEKWIARTEAYKQSFSALSGTEGSRPRWEAEAEIVRADLAMYKGIYSEAESRYAKAHALLGEAIELDSQLLSPDQRASDIAYENHRADQNYRDNILSWGAAAKRRQGRLLEAEADVRQALLNRLKVGGRNSPAVGGMTTTLTSILIEQGRHAEAARLAPVVLDIYLTLGVPADSTRMVGAPPGRQYPGKDRAMEEYA